MTETTALRPPRSGDLVWTSLSVPHDTWTLVIADPSFAIRFVVTSEDLDPDFPMDDGAGNGTLADEPTIYDITTTMAGLIDLGRQRPRPQPESLDGLETDAAEHAELGTFDYDGPFPTVVLCAIPCAASPLEVLGELEAIEYIRCGLLASLEDRIRELELMEEKHQAALASERDELPTPDAAPETDVQ